MNWLTFLGVLFHSLGDRFSYSRLCQISFEHGIDKCALTHTGLACDDDVDLTDLFKGLVDYLLDVERLGILGYFTDGLGLLLDGFWILDDVENLAHC